MYANLKLQLWKSGIRQNRLAQILGMDEAMLSKIVNGYKVPSSSVRRAIADILETDESWLFACVDRDVETAEADTKAKTSRAAVNDAL